MDLAGYLRFGVALVLVVGLIGLLALAARRFGMAPRVQRSKRKGRLAVVDLAPLDGRRRLALIRRDNVEHLVILGATSETVVETGIPVAAADLDPDEPPIEPRKVPTPRPPLPPRRPPPTGGGQR